MHGPRAQSCLNQALWPNVAFKIYPKNQLFTRKCTILISPKPPSPTTNTQPLDPSSRNPSLNTPLPAPKTPCHISFSFNCMIMFVVDLSVTSKDTLSQLFICLFFYNFCWPIGPPGNLPVSRWPNPPLWSCQTDLSIGSLREKDGRP